MLQMKSNQHHISKTTLKKAVAFFAAFCICTSSLEEWNLTNLHRAYADADPTSLIVDKERTLTYAGGRSYTMTLDAAAYLTKQYASTSTSEDGCYVAPFDGKYLVQLWGGNGGNGGLLSENPGGAGGYVYGVVELEKNDVLLYNIGTTGQIAMIEDTGGGANGDGGAHGDEGIYAVGGGGGYSAVYKYDKDEYNNETRPTEADRMQKVVLIAGGGGGGGGHNEAGISDFPTGKPKGGAGGNIASSASGAVDGGTFYAGANGSSSGAVGGSSTKYIGIGGTNKPGPAVYTNGGSHCSEGGNDWYCITDPNRIGGAGGMGNLRGGGGGAGFCGGSGGIVQALLQGRNVGGGGGGSSFVASTVSTNIGGLSTNEYASYEKGVISSNPNKKDGGYCNIVYLPDTEMNFADYSEVTIDFPVSDYFNVEVEGGTWDAVQKQITGVNIAPNGNGVEDNHANITVTFTAKDAFAGGNNVPLFTDDGGITIKDCNGNPITKYDANPDLDYVNVPLKYELTTHSIWLNSGETPEADQLFYDVFNDEMAEDIDETFIAERTPYEISPELEKLTENQEYTISYTVTPNTDSYAKIGPQQGVLDVSGIATVNIKQEGATYIPDADNTDTPQGQLNESNSDVVLTTSRTLVFNGSTYDTQITISAKTGTKGVKYGKKVFTAGTKETSANKSLTYTYTAPSDGWYFIEAYGADGGNGQGTAKKNSFIIWSWEDIYSKGGTGGKGGYASGYVHLNEGETLSITGANKDTTYDNNYLTSFDTDVGDVNVGFGAGGKGGSATVIKNQKGETLLVAGGGGGGGGGAYTSNKRNALQQGQLESVKFDGVNGTNANQADSLETYDGDNGAQLDSNNVTKANGTYGLSGKYIGVGSFNAPSAAKGGKNYLASSVQDKCGSVATNDADAIQPNITNKLSHDDTNGNGQWAITPIILTEDWTDGKDDAEKAAGKLLSDLTFKVGGEWSDYITGDTLPTGIKFPTTGDGAVTVTDDATNHTFKATASKTITISGTPIDGFLGGNDVPMFPMTDNDKKGGLTLQCTKGSVTYPMAMDNGVSLNYVNVAIPEFEFTAQDQEVIFGTSVNIPKCLITSDYTLDDTLPTDDFVELAQSVTPSGTADPNNSTATQTQEYTITKTLSPQGNAAKATVIPPVSSVSYQQSATLNVVYSVDTTGLVNIKCDAAKKFPMGEDFSTTLTPVDGYKLPGSITVEINGEKANPVSQYRYDSQTGELFIPQEYMGNLVIKAEGVVQTYDLVFRVSSNTDNTAFTEYKFSYPAGTTLAGKEWSTWLNGLTIPSFDGYDFKWDLVNDDKTLKGADGELMTEMPANNWFAFGTYAKKEYTLTIHYQGVSENELPDYKQNFYLGDTYSIPSPSVSGYVPDQPVVSGTISDNVTVVVKYTHVTGQLVIVYVYEDGSEARETYSVTMDTDEPYDVGSQRISGYTADKTSVSGTMTENGVYEIVTYHPNEITLTFNAGEGATVSPTNRKAYYGKAFGYVKDGDGYTFEALPTPVKTGCKFLGWYIGTNTQTIDEETICELTEATTLTAKWEADTVTLKIYYLFEDGTTAAEADIVANQVVGSIYALYDTAAAKYQTVSNHDCYEMHLDGEKITSGKTFSIGTTDKAIYVTFVANEYTLTVNYYDENGKLDNYYDENGTLHTLTQSYTVKYGQAYSESAIKPTDVNRTKYAGYTASPDIIEGVMDAKDKTVNVTFVDGGAPITVIVSWSSLNFTASAVAWDTTDHVYYATAFTNDSTSDDYGTITITNESPRTAITADMSYESKFGFESVGCEFSDDSVVVAANGGEQEVTVTPSGKMRCDTAGSYTVGTCKVKLSAGGQVSTT